MGCEARGGPGVAGGAEARVRVSGGASRACVARLTSADAWNSAARVSCSLESWEEAVAREPRGVRASTGSAGARMRSATEGERPAGQTE